MHKMTGEDYKDTLNCAAKMSRLCAVETNNLHQDSSVDHMRSEDEL